MAENISVFGLLVVPDLSYRLFLRLEGAMDSYSSMLDVCGFSFGNCNSPPLWFIVYVQLIYIDESMK